jgi:hypothetical protein
MPEPGSELRVSVGNNRFRHTVETNDVAFIIPREFVHLGSNGNGDEVTLIGESTYDYPKVIIALANWEWANEVHSYRLPRTARDWQAMEQARF